MTHARSRILSLGAGSAGVIFALTGLATAPTRANVVAPQRAAAVAGKNTQPQRIGRRRALSQPAGCSGTQAGSGTGGTNNVADSSNGDVAGGEMNTVCTQDSVIGGGYENLISEGTADDKQIYDSFIGGGAFNAVENSGGGILAGGTLGESEIFFGCGYGNQVTGKDAVVGGGDFNLASAEGAFIGGGGSVAASAKSCPSVNNTASGQDSFIGSGDYNVDAGEYGVVGGGYTNNEQAIYGVIAGGQTNTMASAATGAFDGAGYDNSVSGPTAAIVAGNSNTAAALNSIVVGGFANTSSEQYGSIVGGSGNTIVGSGSYGFIGAGENNSVSGEYAVLSGGSGNSIAAGASDGVLAGGSSNSLSGQKGSIGGGESNEVAGSFATIPGGYHDEAVGNESFAAGSQAEARYTGSFVWSDYVSGEKALGDSAPGEFVARASGGVYFFSNAAASSGVHLAAGSGSWSSLSDRNAKTDIVPLDDASILAKVASLPIDAWQYKTEHGVRHVGPMAQDFYAAFGVGEDDRHITSIDEDGVALAAIKALHDENDRLRADDRKKDAEKELEIDALRVELQRLEAKVGLPNRV